MQIISVRLVNYRCFRDSGEVFLNKFSILIGRNDGGKTSFLKAIDKVLNQDASFEPDDCWFEIEDGEHVRRSKELEVYIKLGEENRSKYHVRATYSREDNIVTWQLQSKVVKQPELNRDFSQLKKADLQELCTQFDIEFKKSDTNASLAAALNDYRATLPKEDGWIELPTDVAALLPRVNLYASVDETGPDKAITDNLNDKELMRREAAV